MTQSTWALIPMKSLEHAKTRLGNVLSRSECAGLSRAMLLDVFNALQNARRIDQIAVLTGDPAIQVLVENAGHLVIEDESAGDINAGLTKAAHQLRAAGATTVVIIPGDLPTISDHDIDQLLSEHSAGVSLCIASRDGGTNALVCTPPDAISFRFGPDSARLHQDTANAANIPVRALRRQAFVQDIDTPEDLHWLTQQTRCPNSLAFLEYADIDTRMHPPKTGTSA